MAADTEDLILSISADTKQMQRALQRLVSDTDGATKRMQSDFAKMSAASQQSVDSLRKSLTVGSSYISTYGRTIAAAFTINAAKNIIDQSVKIQNALKVVGLSGKDLTTVYQSLYGSAQKNAAPFETLVELYSKAALQQKELGVSTQDLLKFTDNVAVALRVQGTDAQAASGALLQLSQALGTGVVRAQEFNSILDQVPTIAQAAAAGLKEANGSVAALRNLVVTGKVSSAAFFAAFNAGADILQQRVAGAEVTVSQGLVRLQNVLIDTATRLDDSTHASQNLATFMAGPLTDAIREIGDIFNRTANGPIGSFVGAVDKAIDTLIQKVADLGQSTGLAKIGEAFGAKPYINADRIQDRINGAFAGTGVSAPSGGIDLTVTKPGAVSKPVSLADYPIKAGAGSATGARRNAYQRETASIEDRTKALQAQTAAQAGLDPLVNDYGAAVETARAKQDLLNAAEKAHIALTPTIEKNIEDLATKYGNAYAAAQKLADAQEDIRRSAQDNLDAARGVVQGVIDDFRSGKSAAETFADVLSKIGDRFEEMFLNWIFPKNSLGIFGSAGGLLGGAIIPGILHSGGTVGRDGYGHGRAVSPAVFAGAPRMHSGGIAGIRPDEVPAILQKGEMVIPRGGRLAGGGDSFNMPITINAPGADAAQLRRVQDSVVELRKNIPKMVDKRNKDKQLRKVRA
jgi:tape measure domain-containing protein